MKRGQDEATRLNATTLSILNSWKFEDRPLLVHHQRKKLLSG